MNTEDFSEGLMFGSSGVARGRKYESEVRVSC